VRLEDVDEILPRVPLAPQDVNLAVIEVLGDALDDVDRPGALGDFSDLRHAGRVLPRTEDSRRRASRRRNRGE
jgi:hypothetical protein